MIKHGGRLNAAVRRTGIPRGRWLDLSTGINPAPWPVPELPARVWQRLPEEDDGLPEVIRHWSGVPDTVGVVPLPGSQAAIQILPRLRRPGRIAIPTPAYSEHAFWWRAAGHEVIECSLSDIDDHMPGLDGVVCVNPGNPTGDTVSIERLLEWHRRLAEKGGWLVVDEAFMDATPEASLIPHLGGEGLLVLRSLGKFFGLAGVRAGLLMGPRELCNAVAAAAGPWALSHPARYLMKRALADTAWQERTRQRLASESARLGDLLHEHGLPPGGGTALFQYCPHPAAAELAATLERHAVLVRVFKDPSALRFGLPGSPAQWQQLQRALGKLGTATDS